MGEAEGIQTMTSHLHRPDILNYNHIYDHMIFNELSKVKYCANAQRYFPHSPNESNLYLCEKKNVHINPKWVELENNIVSTQIASKHKSNVTLATKIL